MGVGGVTKKYMSRKKLRKSVDNGKFNWHLTFSLQSW